MEMNDQPGAVASQEDVAPPPGGEEGLTQAEADYLKSGGSSEAAFNALLRELGGDAPADPAQPAAPATDPQAGPQGDPDGGDEDDGEHIHFDSQGRARDARTGQFVRQVPLGAMLKERERFQRERQRADDLAQQLAQSNATMGRLTELSQELDAGGAPKAPAEKPLHEQPEIDPATDFVGAFQQMQARVAYLTGELERRDGATRAQLQQNELRSVAERDISAVAAAKPDFGKAFEHLATQRDAELALSEPDPAKRRAQIISDTRQIVSAAIQQGRSPGQMLYDLAVARGYKAPAADPDPANAGTGNPDPAPATPGADQVRAIEQRVENVQKSQQANKSLQDLGGSTKSSLTSKSVADMDDDDVVALRGRLGRDGFNRMMRGG